jgi:hypothetical protein
MGGEQYIAPAVKFRLHNRSDIAQHSVQAMAVFRRKGEENVSWGSAFEQVVSRKAPLEPGQSVLVTLKSDARYHSQGPDGGDVRPRAVSAMRSWNISSASARAAG